MPELPEVETVRRQLQAALAGRRFSTVEMVEPFMLRDAEPEQLPAVLPGRVVLSVDRVGKFMVMPLSGGWFLTVHLGMTGQLLVMEDGEVTGGAGAPPYRSLDPVSSHDRFVFHVAPREAPGQDGAPAGAVRSGATRLVFRDIRKFGRLHLTPGAPAERLRLLGPDAWLGDWAAGELAQWLDGRTAPLKSFLLDQRRLAGIGNIYADEILFAAALSPLRPSGSLTGEEVERLAAEIRARLEEGVRLRGCSFSDFVDTKGRLGTFQDSLKAYGRQGQTCPRCGATLVRIVIGGRGTAYCVACQR